MLKGRSGLERSPLKVTLERVSARISAVPDARRAPSTILQLPRTACAGWSGIRCPDACHLCELARTMGWRD